MRNLRKLLAVVVTVAVMVTMSIVPAFAADAVAAVSADAQVCADLGMLVGAGAGVTADYTATQPSRIQAAILLLRLKGLEADAKAFTGTDNFSDVQADWMKPYTAYLKANPSLGWIGSDGKFDPDSKVTAAQYYKVVLTALGYTQKADAAAAGDFEFAKVLDFAAGKGLSKVATATSFTIDNLATATVEGLKAAVKDGTKTLAATLVDAGKVDASKATAAGLYATTQTLDIDNASAINSKVVEVDLNTAVTSVSKADITVKDAAGKAIAVVDAKLADWDAKKKTALFWLESDTSAGAIYTVVNGTTSVNFGGKAADTARPEIEDNGITSIDYNEINIQFKEPVQLDGATVTIAAKYGDKAALATTNVFYGDDSSNIRVTTASQNSATLYAVTVSGVKDFAGNVMTLDGDKTFAGKGASTDPLKVSKVAATDCDTVLVQFNVNVDPATIAASNFTIVQQYGANTSVTVQAARLATTDDVNINANDVKLTSAEVKKHVVLTVDPTMKNSTQYKVTVSGLKTLYGKAMSTTTADTWASFTGKKKPDEAFSFTTPTAVGNTKVTIKFDNKVTKESAENLANYSIALAYGTKAALAVTKAALDSDDNKTVTLTTDAMTNNLYKLTVTGVVDIYGNALKTTDDKNIKSFSGLAVADAIDKINSITRPAGTDGNTHIIVAFNKNVGSSASDVSHYFIDNGVGYPTKAETTANANEVKLTIPKTTTGIMYTLTVKNLENADGVAMDDAGVKMTFAGKGNDSTLPEIVSVIAVDNQTLKVYFDRDAKDAALDAAGGNTLNRVWDSTTNALIAGALTYDNLALAGNDLAAGAEYVWQDKEEKTAINVRIPTNDAFKSTKALASNSFELHGAAAIFDADYRDLLFAPNDDEPSGIAIDSVQAMDKKVVRVYFNQPVYDGTNVNNSTIKTFAKVNTTDTFGGWTFSAAYPIDSTNKTWDFVINAQTLAAGTTYYLVVDPNVVKATITDGPLGQQSVTMADEDDSTSKIQQVRAFAGNGDNPADITDISVMATDKNTLVVYYPVAMDKTQVETKGNYSILDAGSTSGIAVKMSDDSSFVAATHIGSISYDKDTFQATIKLLKPIKSTYTGAYVKFSKSIVGVAGQSVVQDGSANIYAQFALSDADAAKLTVTSAAYDGITGDLVITLNQDFSATAKAGYLAAYTQAEFVADFAVTFNSDDTAVDFVIGVGNITAPITVGTNADGNATLTVALDPAALVTAVENGLGSVDFVMDDADLSSLEGVNGQKIDVDMSAVTFVQKAGH